MDPTHTLGYTLPSDPNRSDEIRLLVDGRPLLDLLEAAIPGGPGWLEMADAQVVTKALRASLKQSGEYAIFTCAHCRMPEDLRLQPFGVTHEGDCVIWICTPPGAGFDFPTSRRLEFHFQRRAYEETVRRILAREPA